MQKICFVRVAITYNYEKGTYFQYWIPYRNSLKSLLQFIELEDVDEDTKMMVWEKSDGNELLMEMKEDFAKWKVKVRACYNIGGC